jgi:flagellar biosynthesis/type III secretory pathway protein FliH
MYDPLWEDHPKIKKIRAESEEKGRVKGRTEGRTEGELRASQRILVNVVKARFPDLVELARQKASQISKTDVLTYLIEQVSTAPDENVARWLLSTPAD